MLAVLSCLPTVPAVFLAVSLCAKGKDKPAKEGKSKVAKLEDMDQETKGGDTTTGGGDTTTAGTTKGDTTTAATKTGATKTGATKTASTKNMKTADIEKLSVKQQEKMIAEAIKKGELLPENDNQTINDCESDWGADVDDKKKDEKKDDKKDKKDASSKKK